MAASEKIIVTFRTDTSQVVADCVKRIWRELGHIPPASDAKGAIHQWVNELGGRPFFLRAQHYCEFLGTQCKPHFCIPKKFGPRPPDQAVLQALDDLDRFLQLGVPAFPQRLS